MILYKPTFSEAEFLLQSPPLLNGLRVVEESLPPPFLFEAALVAGLPDWIMPRLYIDEIGGEVVGGGGFKSAPNEGKVEIGYSVAPSRRLRGFATEGVRLLTQEAFMSADVKEVLAEVETDNHASSRVLLKAGFTQYGSRHGDEGELLLWRKTK